MGHGGTPHSTGKQKKRKGRWSDLLVSIPGALFFLMVNMFIPQLILTFYIYFYIHIHTSGNPSECRQRTQTQT